MRSIKEKSLLHNGVEMPWFGLGVYKADNDNEVEEAILTALEEGYRSIDTASFYNNEEGVGRALKAAALPREELFITTKVWNDDHGYNNTIKAFHESRRKLGLEVIDLYLIHWPVAGLFKETWQALEKLYEEGYVRAVGVSNFQPHHLEELKQSAEIFPMVNQVEYHPWLTQPELYQYCKENHVQLEAWSPLTRGRKLDDKTITALAEKYGKTPAQVILRWDLQTDVVTIPKSVTPKRIRENAEIFDFELTEEDVKKISDLNEDLRFGPDPDNFV
ncbi:aldo/keto reductase [Alkalicoccus halolimnae]|uniref:Aldo/keto reductase n=1 Tax=Alkalicoccus halolimnae TaxID=1667239 RepID=A0A5C7FQ60_9BACI|nr:aldo/keto reductase [Alkalicoccus halolimnae]TXF86885.1 aldo/keto reductase [Alkalicoccus halolimnae]